MTGLPDTGNANRKRTAKQHSQNGLCRLLQQHIFIEERLKSVPFLRGIVNQVPVIIEPGAMAWAVPGPFSRVPLKLAAQVGTAGRGFVEDSLFVLITGIPFEADPYNAAVPFLQVRGT